MLLEQEGIVDYFSFTINGEEGNITLNRGEVAIIGAVELYAAQ